jgi:hypothetical protein
MKLEIQGADLIQAQICGCIKPFDGSQSSSLENN